MRACSAPSGPLSRPGAVCWASLRLPPCATYAAAGAPASQSSTISACQHQALLETPSRPSRALWDSASPPPPRRLRPARRAPARVLQASHQALPAEAVRARLRPLDHHRLAQHLKAHSAGEAVRDVALHVHLGALGRHLRAGQAERKAVATRGGKLVLGGRNGAQGWGWKGRGGREAPPTSLATGPTG